MSRSTSFRFAFGSALQPMSTMWTIWQNKKGETFLSNVRAAGHSYHVSIHGTGDTHFKQDRTYINTASPVAAGARHIAVAFYHWDWPRPLPLPPIVDSKAHEITWLGQANAGEILVLKIFFQRPDVPLVLEHGEYEVRPSRPGFYMGSWMQQYLVLVRRPMFEIERQTLPAFKVQVPAAAIPAVKLLGFEYLRPHITDHGLFAVINAPYEIMGPAAHLGLA